MRDTNVAFRSVKKCFIDETQLSLAQHVLNVIAVHHKVHFVDDDLRYAPKGVYRQTVEKIFAGLPRRSEATDAAEQFIADKFDFDAFINTEFKVDCKTSGETNEKKLKALKKELCGNKAAWETDAEAIEEAIENAAEALDKAKDALEEAEDDEKSKHEIAEAKERVCEAKKAQAALKEQKKEHAKGKRAADQADKAGKKLFAEVTEQVAQFENDIRKIATWKTIKLTKQHMQKAITTFHDISLERLGYVEGTIPELARAMG